MLVAVLAMLNDMGHGRTPIFTTTLYAKSPMQPAPATGKPTTGHTQPLAPNTQSYMPPLIRLITLRELNPQN
jgi:hypothetical protein